MLWLLPDNIVLGTASVVVFFVVVVVVADGVIIVIDTPTRRIETIVRVRRLGLRSGLLLLLLFQRCEERASLKYKKIKTSSSVGEAINNV